MYKEVTQLTWESTAEVKKIIFKCVSNVLSLENFINELLKYRFFYRDIVEPLLSGLMQYLYGIKLQIDFAKYSSAKSDKLQNDLEKMVQFPSLAQNQEDFLTQIDSYLNGNLMEEEGDNLQKFTLLKCGLQELLNVIAINESSQIFAKTTLIHKFIDLIKIFVQNWKEQQEEEERLQKETESLYRIKYVLILYIYSVL